ncbi:S-adenosyl-L-methionine-dependent methyltransferase [Pyrenochaeta sp. DS3sAY3a]|nr:S-adenosyl-L-methionine-dependent methyltransferase [Pyrenochaeta sp. DS3sAY3a]
MASPEAQRTALEHFSTLAANYEATTGGCTRELARHLVDILPPVTPDSKILDNACGNGIVAQELLYKNPSTTLDITATDGAAPMVALARHAILAINPDTKLTTEVMPGEALGFPDNSFSHSITNQGILFFKDGDQGAREIYRTLQPGGTAIVTSWSKLGYLSPVHAAQQAVRPFDPLFRLPISDAWFTPAHLEKVLKDAGFTDVTLHETSVWYAAPSVEAFTNGIVGLFSTISAGWSEGEKELFRSTFAEVAGREVVGVKRDVAGKSGETVDMVGVEMVAIVAVARK